jgi:hypothetical protein
MPILLSQECSCPLLCSAVPVISHTCVQFIFESSKTPPSPCVYNIGRPRPLPGSSLGFHLRSNSQSARSLHSSPFRYHFISFHFASPTLHSTISQPSWLHFVFPTLAQGCFSFFKSFANITNFADFAIYIIVVYVMGS